VSDFYLTWLHYYVLASIITTLILTTSYCSQRDTESQGTRLNLAQDVSYMQFLVQEIWIRLLMYLSNAIG